MALGGRWQAAASGGRRGAWSVERESERIVASESEGNELAVLKKRQNKAKLLGC